MIKVEGGSRAAAPKGSMTYAFTHIRNFLVLLAIGIGDLGPAFWAGIRALRLGFEPRDLRMGAKEKFPLCVKA